MSLFISRVRNLSAYRVVSARFFSSLPPESPCFLLSDKTVKECRESGERIVRYRIFDPRTEQVVTTSEKKLPKELIGQTLFGSSQGWVASMDSKDLPINLTDVYKPLVTSPRVIPLPSLGFYPRPFTTELSLSSQCPDQDQEDFTVAAKFCGTHLSVCTPCLNSEWIHIETSLPLVPASELMYSKRDKAFYFTSAKGLYMGSLPLSSNKKEKKKIKYQEVRLCNFPKIPGEMLDRCFASKHLVESPSGDLFLVKWYAQCTHIEEDGNGEAQGIHSKTKRFMVFRQDKKRRGYFSYTEDIGDLCIFLSKGEALCLSSSMYPGLKPNSIYYIGHGLGSYDLASGAVHSFESLGATMLNHAPFWIH
ncbi:hypothetical protein BRARA_B00925 [Brassica rapa]|uniref:KIB1-4 beta-propeller domain-containing protein n=3 Tax=Brassica TaxID=3705 RepID=A0ABQ8AU95_BRANA|nr:hypothetical protein HID58_045669 [Brassica napus]RID73798.1 hypothetical protein BRARA_B00925 [Brassica rapa]